MNILMVCLGNICRSPLAEAILRKKANEADLDVNIDSCGTSGYHNGENPDPRSVENASLNGVDISELVSRKFQQEDFENFDLIYVMDSSNYKAVLKLARNKMDEEKVELILNEAFPGENRNVPDPYFGGKHGFQDVFDLLDAACKKVISNHL